MGKKSILNFAAQVAALALILSPGLAQAARGPDLPVAAESSLAGIGFDDKPLFLPVERNFQMAMITAGSELGRSCGKMEAYGWRLNQSEQARVDQIFNSTVDRLRGLGYVVEMQNPSSISRDITMFTADRTDKHLLTMWSAGEIGLVMVICQTGAPTAHASAPAPLPRTMPQSVERSALDMPLRNPGQDPDKFTPVGVWTGSYICAQGYTGATLTIKALHGNDFDGILHFYPTAKNPSVPDGSYSIFGQYDPESKRILINPGRWIKRPHDYYNTIIVGSFDAVESTFSAYFQGINGCTSFEARRAVAKVAEAPKKHKAAKKHKPVKKAKADKTVKASAPAATSGQPPLIVGEPLNSPTPAPVPAPAAVSGAPAGAAPITAPVVAPAKDTGAAAKPTPAATETATVPAAQPAPAAPAATAVAAPTPAPASAPVAAPVEPKPAAPEPKGLAIAPSLATPAPVSTSAPSAAQ